MTKEEIKSCDGEKTSRSRLQRKDKSKPLTKIIIRHLPPTMTEEEFLKQIDPLPDHDFYYYALADWSLGFEATCRAYINFRNYDDVFLFRDRFDGYVFVDSKGAEYPAIVEFAPFQGLAKNKSRSKVDPKVNTIEGDSHYQNFLQKLEEDRDAASKGSECKLEFSLMPKKDKKVTSTPLLQYLANKKEKRREETKRRTEEKRRQRDEEKERARQRQLQQNSKNIQSQNDKINARNDSVKSQCSNNKKGETSQTDDRKNSRAKRRAERDQRRREEHEQRRHEKEQNGNDSKDCDRKQRNSEIDVKDVTASIKNTSDVHPKSKEVKKYSDRRERQRNIQQTDNSQKIHTISIAEKEKSIETSQPEISDSVKQFIQSVSAVKEFIPKHKINQKEQQQQQQQQLNESNIDSEIQVEKCENKLKTDDIEEKSKKLNQQQRSSNSIAEERRIRNKDRPSIAIYQPKPRLAQSSSDATLSTSIKGHRSNPTSDYENEERFCNLGASSSTTSNGGNGQNRKISRYSEKRMGRNKDKMKERRSSGGDIDVHGNNTTNNRRRNTFDRKESINSSKSKEDLVEKKESTKID